MGLKNQLMHDSIPLFAGLLGIFLGYLLGVSRDRLSAMRAKQIEVMNDLHERALEIAPMELTDGRRFTLAVRVDSRADQGPEHMSDAEVAYLGELAKWREELRMEMGRARLWIDGRTVSLVSNYFLLMMHCQNWENFGRGRLTDDATFLRYVRAIFGRPQGVMRKAVRKHSMTGEPWLLDSVGLSHMCLQVIQRRIHLEIARPFLFRMSSYRWQLREWRNDRFARRMRALSSDTAEIAS